ncbi:GNAT family N-acetyltransferase [Rhodococcus erythropolis]|nr:GNAT family N-acetyltransferase [Rhodococcus erythropolis]MCZ4569429.1 GNAT family N-acetyltransferase [Rhodococcus erythropolis]
MAQPESWTGPDIVPATSWWIARGGRYLGAIQMRHSMNEILADVGGHIGYGVRPPERRRGIASTALQEMLTCATQPVGLGRVLIARNEMNVGSRKAIEVCGCLLRACAQLISRPQPRLFDRHAPLLGANEHVERQLTYTRPRTLAMAAHTCHGRARLPWPSTLAMAAHACHGHSRR